MHRDRGKRAESPAFREQIANKTGFKGTQFSYFTSEPQLEGLPFQ